MTPTRSGHGSSEDGPHLDPGSARALDALVNAGFDLNAVAPDLRHEAARVARLLGLIDSDHHRLGHHENLTDSTLASVLRSNGADSNRTIDAGPTADDPVLSQRDSDALEAFVMAGYDAGRAPRSLRHRASIHGSLADAVTTLDEEGERWIAAGRAVRTEAVLDAVLSVSSSTIPFETPSAPKRFRLADLITVAAMLMLASAVAFPVIGAMTEDGKRRVCTSNLQAAGLGFGLYAQSNDDALPMATAGFGGAWSQVGTPGRSHSANLFTLVRTKHVMPWDLDCPGNEFAPTSSVDEDAQDWSSVEEVSYSYRLMPRGRNRVTFLESDAPVLSDRSPILISGVRGHRISPEASSLNHGREGQHLLSVDGRVRWSDTPVLEDGDNIWLPRVIEEFVQSVRKKYGYVDGYEMPVSPDDTFLGP